MAFMDNYEGNKERTDRWIATYPQGRLETLIVEFNAEKGYVLVQAKAFRGKPHNDDCSICHDIIEQPAGIDYAYGYLAAYPDKMKRWMVEDTCTSALMRVMALVMGGAEKATQEVMAQVDGKSPKAVDYDYWATKFGDVPSYKTRDEAEQAEPIAWEIPAASAPSCSHGSMRWNQSKPDAPKAWAGYFCSEKIKENQCKPRWYVLTSDGTFKPQV
jgi:hypothetical protein